MESRAVIRIEHDSISTLDNAAPMDAARVPHELARAPELGKTPHGARATKEEVFRAIEALTPGDLLKLKYFAAWRMQGLGKARRGRTWEDLLSEAKLTTLTGGTNNGNGRNWNKNVDFVTHLTGAMRSISNHWKRDFDEQEAALESEIVTCSKNEDSTSPLNNAMSEYPSQEREVAAREEWDLIAMLCHDDSIAIQVLEGFSRGMIPTEIMRHYELTKWEYQQAIKRIRLV